MNVKYPIFHHRRFESEASHRTGTAKKILSVAHKCAAVRPPNSQVYCRPADRLGDADIRGAGNFLPDRWHLRSACRQRTWHSSLGCPRRTGVSLSKAFRRLFLWLLAAGLACFADWRFRQAVFDIERFGNGLYGLMRRAVLAGSGLFYVALAAASAHQLCRTAFGRGSIGA